MEGQKNGTSDKSEHATGPAGCISSCMFDVTY